MLADFAKVAADFAIVALATTAENTKQLMNTTFYEFIRGWYTRE